MSLITLGKRGVSRLRYAFIPRPPNENAAPRYPTWVKQPAFSDLVLAYSLSLERILTAVFIGNYDGRQCTQLINLLRGMNMSALVVDPPSDVSDSDALVKVTDEKFSSKTSADQTVYDSLRDAPLSCFEVVCSLSEAVDLGPVDLCVFSKASLVNGGLDRHLDDFVRGQLVLFDHQCLLPHEFESVALTLYRSGYKLVDLGGETAAIRKRPRNP
jgi:hypothetical protein